MTSYKSNFIYARLPPMADIPLYHTELIYIITTYMKYLA